MHVYPYIVELFWNFQHNHSDRSWWSSVAIYHWWQPLLPVARCVWSRFAWAAGLCQQRLVEQATLYRGVCPKLKGAPLMLFGIVRSWTRYAAGAFVLRA